MKVLLPALHESARGTEQPSAAVRFEVGCRKLTRPSADIVATPADVESPGGISPPGAPRTVHDPLESHGSRCSAVA